jgi:hypothetical protein
MRRGRPCQPVVLHLTPYFYNWPVRIWPICRPEGDVGTCILTLVPWSMAIQYPMAAVQSLVGGELTTRSSRHRPTHQKSVSWNVPEVGLAHDPRRGN